MQNFILFYNFKNFADKKKLLYFSLQFAKQCTSGDESEKMLMESEDAEDENTWLKKKYWIRIKAKNCLNIVVKHFTNIFLSI